MMFAAAMVALTSLPPLHVPIIDSDSDCVLVLVVYLNS